VSIECEPTPLPCNHIFLPTFSISAPYICRRSDEVASIVSNLTADVVENRTIYDNIPCNCIQEYDLKVVQGIITCVECKIPNTPCLVEPCNCILDTIAMQQNAVNVIVSQYPYGEEVFFYLLLECALQFSDLEDIYIYSPNAVFTLTNFQENTIPNTINIVDRFEATLGFTNTPSRLFSVAIYDIQILARDPFSYPCCEAKATELRYVLGVSACIRLLNYDITPYVNTKEDEEVLKGLWIGDYAYQQYHDVHIIKNAKIIDIL